MLIILPSGIRSTANGFVGGRGNMNNIKIGMTLACIIDRESIIIIVR